MQENTHNPKKIKAKISTLMLQKSRKIIVPQNAAQTTNAAGSNNSWNILQDLEEEINTQEKESISNVENKISKKLKNTNRSNNTEAISTTHLEKSIRLVLTKRKENQ